MGRRPHPPQVRDRGRDGDSGPGELGAEEQGLLFSPEGPGFISQIDYGFMCGCVRARSRTRALGVVSVFLNVPCLSNECLIAPTSGGCFNER